MQHTIAMLSLHVVVTNIHESLVISSSSSSSSRSSSSRSSSSSSSGSGNGSGSGSSASMIILLSDILCDSMSATSTSRLP